MIKNCRSCRWAEWTRAKNGRILPDGYAQCMWPVPTVWPVSRRFSERELTRPAPVYQHRDTPMNVECKTWERKI